MSIGKVLLVDDIDAIREISRFYFESMADFTFLEAASGEEASKVIQDNPDLFLVFSDFNMHPGNGFSVLKSLRAVSKAPFILHTSEDIKNHPEFNGYENVYHADKPLNIDDLTKLVQKFIAEKNTDSQQAPQLNESQFLPVHLSLLSMIQTVKCPIYIAVGEIGRAHV